VRVGAGGGAPFHVVVIEEIKAAQSVEVLLGLVVEHGERFNFVNLSNRVECVSRARVDARDAGGHDAGGQDAPRERQVCKADRL
jgi:predicted TIM-barrel enzyme